MQSLNTKGRRRSPFFTQGWWEMLTSWCRYAEMDKTAKNKISHRFKALQNLQAWFAAERPR